MVDYSIEKFTSAHADIILNNGEKENATVELDAKNSSAELNQSISKYMWDFGDGNISNSSNVNHSYDKSGNYVITLTVESTSGMSSSISKQITIHE